ncbi:MAG: aminomethyl-transferring glycine dehydrogenase, partial [Methyloprofundus sp.]|nr:aminomethyl-transferring glycine dehydrogenase [Methyloprofundus sp.]
NASLLDEATAAAEAMNMSRRLSKSASNTYIVDQHCHPQTIAVLETHAESLGFEILLLDILQDFNEQPCFGVLAQYPNTLGEVHDYQELAKRSQEKQALLCIASDLLSLVLLKAPADFGADIVLGSAQRFGVPMGYGGPHAAFFATKEIYKRSMPGRIIGASKDSHGDIAYRMALQTREQHIRREKATSNICTAQVLLAILSGFYAIYHGEKGLKLIAGRVHRYTQILAQGLQELGYSIQSEQYFDTLIIATPAKAKRLAAKAEAAHINLRLIDRDTLAISLDETSSRQLIRELWLIFAASTQKVPELLEIDQAISECIEPRLLRGDAILQHPVFNAYHSETEMMRYIRRLAAKDIALDRAMIPLGSCTMKLNSATSMQAISFYEFSNLHPFVPYYQAQGYHQLFEELENMLCDLTGFSAFSLQPNAGSQGEYSGLLVIRRYHQSRQQAQRNICLIPESAHGTNPASAILAGYQLVNVPCDQQGNINMTALKLILAEHAQQLAAIMITYPSTHGVFEEGFCEVCELVHEAGGQVYLDGANFNALLGLSKPGKIGADVAHLNLHKTFSIPHGGGGPGVGPIGVGAHLVDYLPTHPVVSAVNPVKNKQASIGTISAAPWGSASILTISWSYIAMMGAAGLKKATLCAILNANYIAKKLASHYPILYTGKNGWVAHECIIDCSGFKKSSGISVNDIAKRLIDYGFHAPTVAFPVHDTLMIEPTESENKIELDRFCVALIAIRQEIAEIELGNADKQDNLLRNAPHTYKSLIAEHWSHAYSRQQAFFPMKFQQQDKYWPPVGRIDEAYGDRHLVCQCL